MNAFQYELTGIEGGTIRLSDYTGRAILLVNTASECETTPQYAGLQALHERYGDRGLIVIGVPSNDFGGQEPADEATILPFCRGEYGVTFPLAAKHKVIPPDEHPLYRDLAIELGDVARPQWNFHKYLFGPDGELAGLWDSRIEPDTDEIVEAIESVLPSKGSAHS